MKYVLAAFGRLRRGDWISPAVTIRISGEKVNGKAAETTEPTNATKRPVAPGTSQDFAAPGFFQYVKSTVVSIIRKK